jgi:hypothetical protein
MLRGLKVTMIVFGAIVAVEGLLDVVLPVQRAAAMGLGPCASQAQLPMTVLGATWLIAGVWIVAGARDPVRYLNTVRFSLAFPLLLALALLGAALRGHVPLRQVAFEIALDALFVVLFVVFYPRGKATSPSTRTTFAY